MTNLSLKFTENFLKTRSEIIFLIGSILTSFGILLVTVGGSWDITNHLLSKPETFFSPPHALMYSGVAVTLIGVILYFVGWKNLQKFRD
jgi:amino acid transporter